MTAQEVRQLVNNGDAIEIAVLQSVGYEITVAVDTRNPMQFIAYVITGTKVYTHLDKDLIAVEREAMHSATEIMLSDIAEESK